MSVSKLTKELHCLVAFYPDFCVFQDLSDGKVKGIGKEEAGLYLFINSTDNKLAKDGLKTESCGQSTKALNSVTLDIDIWHKRLGHVSSHVLKQLLSIDSIDSKVICKQLSKCKVCPAAKQVRLPFPSSSTKTLACFELVHMDIWGPYKIPTFEGN